MGIESISFISVANEKENPYLKGGVYTGSPKDLDVEGLAVEKGQKGDAPSGLR